ncbi:MAG: histidine phosphatase family protein [Sphingobium sp.]
MRRIFVVRHGNTFGPDELPRRIGARTDLPLVESGRRQAALLGQWFANEGVVVGRLLSGPLLRARETAAAIGAALGYGAVGTRPWLDEIDHGPDEGGVEAGVIARLGAQAIEDWDRRGIAPADWTVDAEARLAGWRGFLAEEAEGDDILITSNGAARFALLALGESGASLKLRTGAFGEIAVEAGRARLVRWNVRP